MPSCHVVPGGEGHVAGGEDDLRVMVVAELLLLGSEAGYWDTLFRYHFLSRFFSKSFEILKPDMLLVLGDVSAKGSNSTRSKWKSVIHQFHRLLGPFASLPFHVTLGDRDIGDCSGLNPVSINWISSNFPGLDSAGCGAFEISNITFVSINSVALLCGNNMLRFSVEKVIERESIDLRMESDQSTGDLCGSRELRLMDREIGWRENAISSGSGPVLLLHFPMHEMRNYKHWGESAFDGASSHLIESRGLVGRGPYGLQQTLPANATEYIFQALKPRMIFSAHTREFGDLTHSDGTREIVVPAMSWGARDDPGFVIATFRKNGTSVNVSSCSLAKESLVLTAYIIVIALFISAMVLGKLSNLTFSCVL